MSSFSSETLHPRADQLPCLPCECLHRRRSPQTRGQWGTATTYSTARSPQRGAASFVLSDSPHNLSGWASWRPHASLPTCKVSLPESLAPAPRSGPAEHNAGAPRRYQPRHRRRRSQGMHEGPTPSRGPGPVTLPTGSPISERGASPPRGRRRRRRAGQRARWQRRCSRRCWPACCRQCSCRPQAAAAQESAGTARQWAAAAQESAGTARESAGAARGSEARGNRTSKTARYRTRRCFLMIRRPPRSTRAE